MKTYTLICNDSTEELRLDKFLAKKLDFLSRSQARVLIQNGAVYINKKRSKVESRMVYAGNIVTLHLNKDNKANKEDSFIVSKNIIIFEDEDLLVVNKPASLPSQATYDTSRKNLYDSLKEYLCLEAKNKQPYIAIHHRLDRDTTGVILFTKSKKWNKEITDEFRNRIAQKMYLAIVEGKFPEQLKRIEKRIASKPNKQRQYPCVEKGGNSATTEITFLDSSEVNGNSISLLLVKPKTGRTHQIRTHLSSEGFPILGDKLYGSKLEVKALFLHAYKLLILQREFVAAIPDNFLKIFPNINL